MLDGVYLFMAEDICLASDPCTTLYSFTGLPPNEATCFGSDSDYLYNSPARHYCIRIRFPAPHPFSEVHLASI